MNETSDHIGDSDEDVQISALISDDECFEYNIISSWNYVKYI